MDIDKGMEMDIDKAWPGKTRLGLVDSQQSHPHSQARPGQQYSSLLPGQALSIFIPIPRLGLVNTYPGNGDEYRPGLAW